MSDPLKPIKEAVQQELKRRGLYLGEIDGLDGSKTWGAIQRALGAPQAEPEQEQEGMVDERSERNIATLTPNAQSAARAFIRAVNDTLRSKFSSGMTVKIIDGSRTYAQQNAIYEIGRSRPNDEGKWKTVTDVRGGYSSHNFGIAFDIGVFGPNGEYHDEHETYDIAGQVGKSLGLSWGGDWTKPVDKPHFYLRPAGTENLSQSDLMVELRRRHVRGEAIA